MKQQLRILSHVITCICMVATSTAYAQIEEIIVTAQKREQSLNEVPISILAFSEESIAMKRIETIDDLSKEVPGFVAQTPFRSQTSPAIRGAGSIDDSPSVDQTVAFFVDGIYIGQPGHIAFSLFDLERVEVLRGPQGTLQGRNVTGGAINLITRTPGDETIVKGEVTVGSRDLLTVQGLLSGALIEGTLAGQLAFSSRYADGYINNRTTGNELESTDVQGARATLAWTPTDGIDAKFSFAYSVDKSFGSEINLEGSSGVVGDPVAGSKFDADDDVYLDTDGGIDRDLKLFSATINFDTQYGTLTSVTGYYESDNGGTVDVDGGSFPAVTLDTDDNLEQFSQELRLTGNSGKFGYTVGAYYLNADHLRAEQTGVDFPTGTATHDFFNFVVGINDATTQNIAVGNETESIAIFGDVTFELTEQFTLIAGGRWTRDEKDFSYVCSDPSGPLSECATTVSYEDNHAWEAFSWRGILQYHFADKNMAYASVSRGFKSGGTSLDNVPSVITFGLSAEDARLEPEFAINYEVGAKLFGFDNKLSLNTTVFYSEYSDMQVLQFETFPIPRSFSSNAASADVLGVEVEIAANPIDSLDIFASYAYLDTEYEDFLTIDGDFSGNNMILAPKHAVNAGATYSVDLANGGAIRLHADVLYKSKYFGLPSNEQASLAKLPAFVNASISYRFPNERWSLTLWGKNLTNERRAIGGIERTPFFQDMAGLIAGNQSVVYRGSAPLSWGVTVAFQL